LPRYSGATPCETLRRADILTEGESDALISPLMGGLGLGAAFDWFDAGRRYVAPRHMERVVP
jgi:hypothetical protein